ncbi:outer membrane beta-barrel protein [Rufibacter latericius]|uniref:Outer membrane protein beta-barrel domain-containing protein n=1 Tax=Rufibacter latericius TaxID=2487040 RepID=A0A3M9MNW6_9BACT|nr:outer membrane beta-barrel protein [Rufibacter latericius]RNI26887.1 hypothetical protein EFB08_10445 [Rufibacter latericius]
MKKLFIAAVLCSTPIWAFAQDFGKTLISGSASYSSSKTESNFSDDNQKNHRFAINPKVGFFVSPNWAMGLSAGYESSTSPSPAIVLVNGNYINLLVDYDSHSYTAGPFVRYYKAMGNKAAFFGQASANYIYVKSEYEELPVNYISTPSTNKGGEVNITPGFVFFPSNTIGLEFMMGTIGYSQMKYGTDGSDYSSKSNSFNASFGLSSLSLGLSLYLGRTTAE